MKSWTIDQRTIGPQAPPWIVAEMSGNHNQSLDRAMALVEAAAAAGAHALKLQTYTAETMTLDLREGAFFIDDPENLWHGHSLYELYQKAYTPWEWHEPLFKRARELGMTPFSTPFDASAVDFLESLDVPCYKIASFENIDLPLIEKVAKTGKPVIVSTGMASRAELEECVTCIRGTGNDQIALLKCTSAYPAKAADANLQTIPHLRDLFDCLVGLSDHSMGLAVPLAATVLGAVMIEKHFTLSREDGGVDSAFSLEPLELKALVEETAAAHAAIGSVRYGSARGESASRKHRRSLYISKTIKAGERFSHENLRAVRPGEGLPPKWLATFIGKRANRDLQPGTPLSWDHIG